MSVMVIYVYIMAAVCAYQFLIIY